MKTFIFALIFVVFASAQVLTFTESFADTANGETTTNLIKIKNNAKFSVNGENAIRTIKTRIEIESASNGSFAEFTPNTDMLLGAITGGAEGYFYFNVTGTSGTYKCLLQLSYSDWQKNMVHADPYRFTFKIRKEKKGREENGRVRPAEQIEVIPVPKIDNDTVAEEGRIQSRQTSNPYCPTPNNNDLRWSGCNVEATYPETTYTYISFKNQMTGTYAAMQNVTYSFTAYSPNTAAAITSTKYTQLGRNALPDYTIAIAATSCDTWFTFNVHYYRAHVSTYAIAPGTVMSTWSTVFKPIYTYPGYGQPDCLY